MKTLFRNALTAAALVALLAGAANAKPPVKPAAEAPRQVKQYTIDQFLANTSYGGGSFSPDGRKILVGSNKTGVFNAFAIPVAGGEPVQLTDSKVSAIQPIGYFPHDERFLYSSDQGGNEKNHLYAQSPDGKIRDLTPGDNLKAQFMGWSKDEKSFFLGTNEREASAFDVYEMAFDGYERKLLYKNEGAYLPEAVSPDRRYIALAKSVTNAASDIDLYDRTTGKLITLASHEDAGAEVANSAADFSPDGKSLYYTTDKGSQFAYLVRYDLATGQRTEVLRPQWDVQGAGFSRDGRWFNVAVNNDARTELRVFEAAGMKPVKLPAMQADITGINFQPHGSLMSFYAESAGPRDLYVSDLKTGKVRQLTHALNAAIDPKDLVPPQVVRFKSFDGTEIPGLLYKPLTASPTAKVPGLVWVHGGPGGQSRIGYSGLIQYLVNHGYAIYAINNRGSSGYGKAFYAMDDRKHGEGDLDDCVATKKMFAATGWVDPARIGIIGGSYGGYMVLAALAFRPTEFAAGVDLFGVSNWLRTLESIPAWWGPTRDSLYKELGDPKADADYLRKISPLFHADQIERPLIVLQGENDPRVLKAESSEIVDAVKKKGVPVEFLLFPNEGHGFNRRDTQEKAYTATLQFLDKYLKGASGS
ncbi:MAG TPA: prolyl oligopeptidase family serine peptidase [Thermoanaerobaculia bacterium]|jgi:dipeptidyl aminopeptidase/acylaminoacyl peptidase|nr:prolyl oligopeptidase family serine peptidase [Thermoanaerobaculia bacterium]